MLPVLLHLGLVLVGSPLYTLHAYRRAARDGLQDFETAAAVRRRVLKASSQIELFLIYSFLLLADKYVPFQDLRESAGAIGAAAVFTLPILVTYGLGCWTRSIVDRKIRNLGGTSGSHLKFHLLLLFLRMGAFVLATPLFFFSIYNVSQPLWNPSNLMGITCVTLLFFIYVFRGPNLILSAFGIIRRFHDPPLEEEIRSIARDRKIPVRGIRVLSTWQSRFAAAFAHFGSSQIFVTDHLQEVVDRDELKAVLFHEVGHLGQLRVSLIRVVGSYLVFMIFVFLKYVIDATALEIIGYETLIPGFLAAISALLVIRHFFGKMIREGEVLADLFSADIVGGRKLYHQAIAKILQANGLSMRFSPSAAEVSPGSAELDEELW